MKVTKEIYDYAMKTGTLKFKDGLAVKEFKLDTRDWEKKAESAMTFTLGF